MYLLGSKYAHLSYHIGLRKDHWEGPKSNHDVHIIIGDYILHVNISYVIFSRVRHSMVREDNDVYLQVCIFAFQVFVALPQTGINPLYSESNLRSQQCTPHNRCSYKSTYVYARQTKCFCTGQPRAPQLHIAQQTEQSGTLVYVIPIVIALLFHHQNCEPKMTKKFSAGSFENRQPHSFL